jgi:phosphoglucosamine mutase
MKKSYFGTDGIRGQANSFPMTAEIAMKVAMATAIALREFNGDGTPTNRVIIGKDTRLSCYMLEQALTAGFLSMGMNVILSGPIPTPGVAMLARSMRADIGVMISASHNPFTDNGIKLFGADGYKLDDSVQHRIEELLDGDVSSALAAPDALGKASRLDDVVGRYVEHIKRSIPKDDSESFDGLKVVVDCANGAAYKVAPQVLWEMEADVISIGVTPDGRNINKNYGATDTANLSKAVLAHGADIGIALDGDADRLIVVDEAGAKIDGDQIMAALAVSMRDAGLLNNNTLVATVMSNLGLERFLKSEGIELKRTAVGDRYVVEEMRKTGCNLGGEQSGHIVLSDFATTGDGLLAALQILRVLKRSGGNASSVLKMFDACPQILKNVIHDAGQSGAVILEKDAVKGAVQKAEQDLANDGAGRLLVRKSGTEPLIRVMAEGDDADTIENIVDELCSVIEKASQKG